MTTERALRDWAEYISPLLKEFAAMMDDERMHDLPSDLAKQIDKAAIELGLVGELLLKYSPKRKGQ